MHFRNILFTLLILFTGTTCLFGQTPEEKSAVSGTLDSFYRAITDNDSTKAADLLAVEARILEGGSIETRDQYLSHHFHSDGKFLSAMQRKMLNRTVSINGTTAWVSTRSRLWGSYSDRKLDLNSLELAVLKKSDGQWKITALHWSSASRQ